MIQCFAFGRQDRPITVADDISLRNALIPSYWYAEDKVDKKTKLIGIVVVDIPARVHPPARACLLVAWFGIAAVG